MSVIQNSNARGGVPTSFAEFPNVLSSLESSDGNVPLTPNQRADMLQLMAETNTADPNISATNNNVLITPTPPPMPQDNSGHLTSTRAEIDNLAKMQAEQDRSVQNLANMLQPLSPTGTIPGIGQEDRNVPPPPLDLDQFFTNDYFTDFADFENKPSPGYGDSTNTAPGGTHDAAGDDEDTIKDASDLFDFDQLPVDGDLFGGANPAQPNPNYFNGGFDGTGYGNKAGDAGEV